MLSEGITVGMSLVHLICPSSCLCGRQGLGGRVCGLSQLTMIIRSVGPKEGEMELSLGL